jgi:hypothetical protein
MYKRLAAVFGGFALLAVAVYGVRLWVQNSRQEAGDRALARTAKWAQGPNLAARLMVDEYGPPQWVGDHRLEWFTIPPWKRIVVTDSAAGFLEHAVSYSVPPERSSELHRFKRGLSVDAENGELKARGESEEDNLLCLNLANDIAQGKRTAAEADEFYSSTVQKSMAGKASVYMERLLFPVTLPRETEMPLP